MTQFQKERLYYVRFYDHCLGDEEMICEVCGWPVKETEKSITLSWWNVTNSKEWRDSNLEPVCIMKSCVIKKRVLRIP